MPGSAMTGVEIANNLPRVPGWSLKGNAIDREFVFGDFRQAMVFVGGVACAADGLDHHPDICVYYNKVRLTLSTHKAGGLTEKDFALAERIDRLVE